MITSDHLTNRMDHQASLTDRQLVVLRTIAHYYEATGEPCSMSYVARRLGIHHETVRDHVQALARKGWLRAPGPCAFGRVRIG